MENRIPKLIAIAEYFNNKLIVGSHFDPEEVIPYFQRYKKIRDELVLSEPENFSDLPDRDIPKPLKKDFIYEGYIEGKYLQQVRDDILYILGILQSSVKKSVPPKKENIIFISHGKNKLWLEIQTFIEKDLNYRTIELEQQPNLGRTIIQKLEDETNKCYYAVILMTGDDIINDNEKRARENVMHEIGFLQGKLGLNNVCILYEKDTNIPSNISGIVYLSFENGNIDSVFYKLKRELDACFDKTK